MTIPQKPKLLFRDEVCARTRVSEATIRRMIARGQFPRPLNIGFKRVAWLEPEIEAWLAERAQNRGAA